MHLHKKSQLFFPGRHKMGQDNTNDFNTAARESSPGKILAPLNSLGVLPLTSLGLRFHPQLGFVKVSVELQF